MNKRLFIGSGGAETVDNTWGIAEQQRRNQIDLSCHELWERAGKQATAPRWLASTTRPRLGSMIRPNAAGQGVEAFIARDENSERHHLRLRLIFFARRCW